MTAENGKHHTGRGVCALGEHMMDETAMQAAIAVGQWVNVDEPECDRGGL